jgi:hypothetical protein
MKAFNLNLQTILFMTDLSVLGAFNKHTSLLVYNKPIVNGETLSEMKAILAEQGLEVKDTYQTDSFGITFYNPNTGGSSTFHEVVNNDQSDVLKKVMEYLVADTCEEYLEMYERIKAHPEQDDYIDYVDDVQVWQKIENTFSCKEFIELVEA